MAKLMIASTQTPLVAAVTKIGGLPIAPRGTAWPCCSTCKEPMQFLGQIFLPDTGIETLSVRQQLLLVFQCQNDPGMCDDWDPESGGNAAILVPITDLAVMQPPVTDKSRSMVLDKTESITATDYDDSRHDSCPDDGYAEAMDAKGSRVVGKLGGRPLWIQGNETPKCTCGNKMVFVAQVEFRAGGGINFGDAGAGYAYACSHCESKAKFLWQCS